MAKPSPSTSLNFPHHDGSELYVFPRTPEVGDQVILRIRVPKDYTFAKSFIRVYEDGEPRSYELSLDKKGEVEDWWKVQLVMVNKVMRYRFVFLDEGISDKKLNFLPSLALLCLQKLQSHYCYEHHVQKCHVR